jgi:leucyl-tRNA synthetase
MPIIEKGEKQAFEPFPNFYAHGLIIKDGAKMSKSKGNVVIPDAYIKKFGADTLRTYLMFLGPFSDGGDFRDTGIEGMSRFLKRVWVMGTGKNITSTPLPASANRVLHSTIKGVTEDLVAFRYNTAIAKLMTLYNTLSELEEIEKGAFKSFLQLLAPFAPHMTEELWEEHEFAKGEAERVTGEENWSIHTSAWPTYDPKALETDTVVVVVQVNGKLRSSLELSKDVIHDQNVIEEKARASEAVKRHIEGKEVKKVVYIPGKILNFVVS